MNLNAVQSRKKEMFSDVFYRRHRKHIFRVLVKLSIWVAVSGAVTGICLASFLQGETGFAAASVSSAVFLFLLWTAYRSVRDQLRVRVIPYFERPLRSVTSFLTGEQLLLYSRRLDEAAVRLGVRPLSEFASGDDMIRGETLTWFLPEEALHTIERLLQPDAAGDLPQPVLSDLNQIRDALKTAQSHDVRFCFLIREGTSASGVEMDRRKGSFF
jgi:hypothetical protein